MDPISKLNLFQPLMPLQPTEGVGAEGRARKVQPASPEQGYNPFGAISKIDGEVTPKYGAQDTSFTNGLGHSAHRFMLMA